jgi:hypothetical protein
MWSRGPCLGRKVAVGMSLAAGAMTCGTNRGIPRKWSLRYRDKRRQSRGRAVSRLTPVRARPHQDLCTMFSFVCFNLGLSWMSTFV